MVLQALIRDRNKNLWRSFLAVQRIWNAILTDRRVAKIRDNSSANEVLMKLVSIGVVVYKTDSAKRSINRINNHVEYLKKRKFIDDHAVDIIQRILVGYKKKKFSGSVGHFEGLPQKVSMLAENNEAVEFLRLMIKYTSTSDLRSLISDFRNIISYKTTSSRLSQILMLVNPYVFPVIDKHTGPFFTAVFGHDVKTREGYFQSVETILEWSLKANIKNMDVLDGIAWEISDISKDRPKKFEAYLKDARIILSNVARDFRREKGKQRGSGEGFVHERICEVLFANPRIVHKKAKRLKGKKSLEFEFLSHHRADLIFCNGHKFWIVEVKPSAREVLGGISQVLGYVREFEFLKWKETKLGFHAVVAIPESEVRRIPKQVSKLAQKFSVDIVGVDLN